MNLKNLLFPPPKEDRFAKIVMAALRRADIEQEPVYDRDTFSITLGEGKLFLGNAYTEYCAAPILKRKEVLRRYTELSATHMSEFPTELAQVRKQLLPRLRDQFYYQEVRLSMAGEDDNLADSENLPPHKTLNEELLVELVIDYPTLVRTVADDNLKHWNLSFDEAMTIAKDNLWAKSKEDFRQVRPGFYVSPWRDSHDASRLFLHDLIWQLKVKGKHVAAVPNRDILLVTGSDDAQGISSLLEAAKEALALPRPMSYCLFLLDGTNWVPFLLPKSHPAYWHAKRMEIEGMSGRYSFQKQGLEKMQKKTGEDIFVASYMAVGRENSPECLSYSVWAENVDTLLPRTDEIAFGLSNGSQTPKEFVRIPWSLAMEVVGSLMEPQNMAPERFRVRRFPTQEQLAAMREKQEATA